MRDNREVPGPRLQLVIDVEYSPGGPPVEELKPMLQALLGRFVGSGGLTTDTSAEVESHEVKVIDFDPGAARLSEDEIATWISLQIESGGISLETLPRQMAVYALANPVDMRNEFAERMRLEAEDRYLFSAWWFTDASGSMKASRWVIDLADSKLKCAELKMEAGGMRQATAVEARTLLLEIWGKSNRVTAGINKGGIVVSSSEPPSWAQAHLGIDLERDDRPTPRDGSAKLLVSEGWGHLFGVGPELHTRWVIDLDAEQLIVAQVKNKIGQGWSSLKAAEAEDLAKSLLDNDMLDPGAADAFDCQTVNALPAWAEPHLRVDLVGTGDPSNDTTRPRG